MTPKYYSEHKEEIDKSSLSMTIYHKRSTYSWTLEDGVICIVDQNRGMSVSNDAENVIQDFIDRGVDVVNQPLIYRDSLGDWDCLQVLSGAFGGFKSLGGLTDKKMAIAKVKQN